MDIQRVSDYGRSPLNEYLSELRHLSQLVCDIRIGSMTLPGAPKHSSGTPTYSQTSRNHSHSTHLPVIRDSSCSEGWPEYPPRV
jgi:hypothetical protein